MCIRDSSYTEPGGTNYRELLLRLPTIEASYKAPHFSGKDALNLVAHVRLNTREDADTGEKVLFLEEVQSDWHQKGREKGYRKPPQGEEADYLRRRKKELITRRDFLEAMRTREISNQVEAIKQLRALGYSDDVIEERLTEGKFTSTQQTELYNISDELRYVENALLGEGGVPDAPFKKSWPTLALRRMIRYAAETGHDAIAWTTGDMQAKRYDLGMVLREIRFSETNEAGTKRTVGLYSHSGGDRFFSFSADLVVRKSDGIIEEVFYTDGPLTQLEGKPLSEAIGKGLAERVLTEEIDPEEGSGFIGDLDMRLGGEGMRAFYDEMLPIAAKQIIKKFGASVGQREVGVETPVPGFDITPGLKQRALAEGFPKFQTDAIDKNVRGWINAAVQEKNWTTKEEYRNKFNTDVLDKIGDTGLKKQIETAFNKALEDLVTTEEGGPFTLTSLTASGGEIGISKDRVTPLRAERGLGELTSVSLGGFEQYAADGLSLIQTTDMDAFANSLLEAGRALGHAEVVALELHMLDLQNKRYAALDEVEVAREAGKDVEVTRLGREVEALGARLKVVEEAARIGGTATSAGLNAFRMVFKRSFSEDQILKELLYASQGKMSKDQLKPISEEWSAKVTVAMEKNRQAQRAADKKKRDASLEQKHQELLKKVDEEAKTPKKRQKKTRAQDNAEKAWTNLLNKLQGGQLEPADVQKEIQQVIAAIASTGTTTTKAQVLAEFRRRVSQLKISFQTAIRFQAKKENRWAEIETLLTQEWDKKAADGEVGVPADFDWSDPGTLAAHAKKIWHDLVANGVRDRDESISMVHEALKEGNPEITHTETVDMLSDFGKHSLPTEDENKILLYGWRQQMLLMRKIEEYEKGRRPPRTGKQRPKPADADEDREIQALKRRLNEVMKAAGIEGEAGPHELRSAFESVLRARENLRDRYAAAIDEKKQFDKPLELKVTDSQQKTLDRMNNEIETLRKKYREMFPQRDQERRLTQMRANIAKIEERINNIRAGKEERPAEAKVTEDTPELTWLTEQRNELRQIYNDLVEERDAPERQRKAEERAVKSKEKRLADRIETLQSELGAGVRAGPTQGQTKPVTSPRIEAQQEMLKVLEEAHKTFFPAQRRELTEEQKIESTKRALQLAIDNYKEAIQEMREGGGLRPAKGQQRIAELEALYAERDEVRNELLALEDEKYPGARQNARYRAYVQRKKADLLDRLAREDFAPKEKKTYNRDAKSLEAKRELEDVQRKYWKKVEEIRRQNMTWYERAWDWVKQFAYVQRSIKTAFDASHLRRQGGIAVTTHPTIVKKIFRPMLESLSSESGNYRTLQDLENHPRYNQASVGGVFLPKEGDVATMKEEAFMGRWAEQLKIGKIAPLRISERMYTTTLAHIRLNLFDILASSIEVNGKLTDSEARVLAKYVNIATGRGDLTPKTSAGIASVGWMLFAPRWLVSRVQFLAFPFTPTFHREKRVRKLLAKEYGRYITGVAAWQMMWGSLFYLWSDDDDDEVTLSLDSRSTDFLKVKWGETRVDMLSGLQQQIVLGSRILPPLVGMKGYSARSDQRIEGTPFTYGGAYANKPLAEAFRFGRKKLAPIPGMIATVLDKDPKTGKMTNVVGEEMQWLPKSRRHDIHLGLLGETVVPLALGEVQSAYANKGPFGGTLLAALALSGEGVQTYGDKARWYTLTDAQRIKEVTRWLDAAKYNSTEPGYFSMLSSKDKARVIERLQEVKDNVVYRATSRAVVSPKTAYQRTRAEAARKAFKELGYSVDDARKSLWRWYNREYSSNGVRKRRSPYTQNNRLKKSYLEHVRALTALMSTK